MKRSSHFDAMSIPEFYDMCHRRSANIAKILGVSYDVSRGDLELFRRDNTDRFITVVLDPPRDVFHVFDETTAAIGEDWLWDNRTFYFVRESDALWFQLRWQ